MNVPTLATRSRVGAGAALLLALTICPALADPVRPIPDGARLPTSVPPRPALPTTIDAASIRQIWFVHFVEPALAMYDGGAGGFRAPARSGGRLDSRTADARAYVAHLHSVQEEHLGALSVAVGRPLAPLATYQLALDAVALELSSAEATRIAKLPGVRLVQVAGEHRLNSDAGPAFTGAPGLWNGTALPSGIGNKGEGIVVAVLDSGIDFASASFAATEPGSSTQGGGYVHVNPLGSGVFLGSCAPGKPNAGRCNAKLIGADDLVYPVVCTPGTPASNPCRPAASGGTIVEAPGADDDVGHGTHVASIAVGDAVNASYRGIAVPVSGVAPHANLLAYDICYVRVADRTESCPDLAAIAAIEAVLADGVADVIDFAPGGGSTPWQDSTSLALLAAQNAGILVVAPAGNGGPQTTTLEHAEPWVVSVAASSHNREFGFRFDLSAPSPAPAATQDVTLFPGSDPLAEQPIAAPLILSPNFATPLSDGCTPFPADYFRRPSNAAGTPGIAVLSLLSTGSDCGSISRRNAALAAGAGAVLFVVDREIDLVAASRTYQIKMADWLPVRTQLDTSPATAAATISGPLSRRLTAQGDVVASFSSRGPALQDPLKPDLSAPGVDILGADVGAPTPYAVRSGTSMASAHAAGAAALLRAAYPTWTPSEVKSAMLATARTAGVVTEHDGTPATPFDNGSGRVDLGVAGKAGLLFDETASRFQNADPATGGDPRDLNLPSLQNRACVGLCTFTRSVRNPLAAATTWTLAASGLPPGAVTFNPPQFTLAGGASSSFQVAITAELLDNSWNFGTIVLTPSTSGLPALHLPVAVYPALSDIALSTRTIDVVLAPGASTDRPLTIGNDGNAQLNWQFDPVGVRATTVLNAPPASSSTAAGYYLGLSVGHYLADDFDLVAATRVASLSANGLVLPQGSHLTRTTAAGGVTVDLFTDAGGKPAGGPEGVGAPAVFSYNAAVTRVGVSVADDGIGVDLVAAGSPSVLLPPGRYWLVAFPGLVGNGSGADPQNPVWGWRTSIAAPTGVTAKTMTPTLATSWSNAGKPALSARVTGLVDCALPSWLSYDLASGALRHGEQSTVTLHFDATGLAAGVHRGALCLDTEGTDQTEPYGIVGISLTVPTAPSGEGLALPTLVYRGGTVLLTVQLVPATGPASSGVSMTVDASTIGGSATQALFDDGSHGDAIAGDGNYGIALVVPAISAAGSRILPVSITDAQARSGTATIALLVRVPSQLDGIASVTPGVAVPGLSVRVEVSLIPAIDPISTGLDAHADLTAIGGGANELMYDDGSHGDLQAGDGIFSVAVTIGLGTTPGNYDLPITWTDAQGRSGNGLARVSITVDRMFSDGFE